MPSITVSSAGPFGLTRSSSLQLLTHKNVVPPPERFYEFGEPDTEENIIYFEEIEEENHDVSLKKWSSYAKIFDSLFGFKSSLGRRESVVWPSKGNFQVTVVEGKNLEVKDITGANFSSENSF